MVLFITKNDNLAICHQNKFVIFNLTGEKLKEIELPPLNIPENLTKNQIEALNNEKVNISTCAFSNCGQFFVVSTTNKQLVVYDNNFEVKYNLNVNRTASKIRFTNSTDLVVADKTGDVYLFKLKTGETEQILGHLSMVLDVLTTKDDKMVITSDRDEKIRVSQFPNSYNIVSFCLGHEEFVSNIELFNENILISASGDGTLRFWDYVSGKELNKINVNEFIEDTKLITTFSEQMDKETVEINALPVTSMKIKHFDGYKLIFCTLHLCNDLFVFKAYDSKNVELFQKIKLGSTILAFDLVEKLFVLCESGIECFKFENTYIKVDLFHNGLRELFDFVKRDIENSSLNESISVLYKRKFDNVQEYQERKKLRIEAKK